MRITRGGVAQSVLVVVGLFLMAAPALLGYTDLDDVADSQRTAGPVIASTAFLGVFPITRLVRWFNVLPGLWLLASPFLLDAPTAATVTSLACGVLVLALFSVERAPQQQYGGGWATLLPGHDLPGGRG